MKPKHKVLILCTVAVCIFALWFITGVLSRSNRDNVSKPTLKMMGGVTFSYQ